MLYKFGEPRGQAAAPPSPPGALLPLRPAARREGLQLRVCQQRDLRVRLPDALRDRGGPPVDEVQVGPDLLELPGRLLERRPDRAQLLLRVQHEVPQRPVRAPQVLQGPALGRVHQHQPLPVHQPQHLPRPRRPLRPREAPGGAPAPSPPAASGGS